MARPLAHRIASQKPIAAAALTLLVVLSGLAFVPGAEGNHTAAGCVQNSAGNACDHIAVNFFGEPVASGQVNIGKDQKERSVEVRLVNNPFTNAGAAGGPGDADPIRRIEFRVAEKDLDGNGKLDASITWNLKSAPLSRPDDWDVSVDNTGAVNVLVFTAKSGSGGVLVGADVGGVPSLQSQRFLLVADATKIANSTDPDGTPSYTVSVTGYNATGAFTHVQDGSTPFTFIAEQTAPRLESATTYDRNGNGHLDGYRLLFNEKLNCDAKFLRREDFKVAGVGVLSITPHDGADVSNPLINPVAIPNAPEDSCRLLLMDFAEARALDTDKLPAITFTNGFLQDTAGNKPSSNLGVDGGIKVRTQDGAQPVLVNALGAVGGNKAILTFSEPVQASGGAPPAPFGPSLASTNTAGASIFFLYCNVQPAPAAGCTNSGTAGDTQTMTGTVHSMTVSQNKVQLNITPVLGANDVSPTRADVRDVVCPTTRVVDVAKRGDGTTITPNVALGVCQPVAGLLVDTDRGPQINIGSLQLEVYFNGPVESADSTGSLKPEHFAIVNTESSSGGPTGITRVDHVKGADYAVLQLEVDPARPTDVDQTPSKLRILPGVVRATGTGGNTGIPEFFVAPGDYNMIDLTDPSILFAETADTDVNGKIDAYFLTFSEPISDDPQDRNLGLLRIQGLPAGPGGYRFDTGVAPGDNKAIIRFPEGTAVYNPYDAQNEFQLSVPFPRGYTGGVPPEFTTEPPGVGGVGLFSDRACNGNLCARNRMGALGNFSVAETDAAPPRVLFADTQDKDRDGYLDGYRVIFSEAVRDSTFKASEWTVAGHVPDKVETASPAVANDHVFTFLFNEGATPDTDVKPQITYTCPPPCIDADGLPERSRGFQDNALNAMQSFDEFKLVEVDAARPVIVKAQGFKGEDKIEIVFSEPVDDGNGGPLIRADFIYSNVDAATNPNGVSGFANSREVQHTAGDEIAILPVNGLLTDSDISKDLIRANVSSIIELASPHRSVPTDAIKLNVAPDKVPPAQVFNIQVVHDLTTATEVRLSFLAPGDDGNETGPVKTYLVKQSDREITALNFNAAETSVVEFLPLNLSAPGEPQSIRILNLTQKTTYHFALVALDDADNQGNVSNSVSETTLEDLTRPFGTLVIASSTHPNSNQGKANDDPKFSWNALTDPESTVLYRWARNAFPEYEVKGTDNTTGTKTTLDLTNVPPGTWYLHVAAFSAGGQTQTAHYKFIVDFPLLEEDEMVLADKAINTTVIRVGGDNVIGWALPVKDALPGELQAVRIWRLQGNEWVLVEELKGDYEDLAGGNITDDSRHASKDSRYLVTAVYRNDQFGEETPTVATYGRGTGIANPGLDIPTWVWILLGVVGALVVAGIIVFFVLRGRAKREAMAREAASGGYQWEEETGKPAGTDPATGLPIHEVKCPSCSTQFKAPGRLPLEITCPNCGVKGTLN